MKIVTKSKLTVPELAHFEVEISVLRKLDHPNIMRLYEVFEDPINYYLVLEMCRGVELFDTIQ